MHWYTVMLQPAKHCSLYGSESRELVDEALSSRAAGVSRATHPTRSKPQDGRDPASSPPVRREEKKKKNKVGKWDALKLQNSIGKEQPDCNG